MKRVILTEPQSFAAGASAFSINERGMLVVERSMTAPVGWIAAECAVKGEKGLRWFVPADAKIGDEVKVLVGSDWETATLKWLKIIAIDTVRCNCASRFAVGIRRTVTTVQEEVLV